ncbi:unnamed protein product [Tuber aestivum]|uniref:Uncharacterized protein n=1 Tax=Tuber aestivum TaxID=59557 RepID=A0A292PPU5_9PEZI|nr:unnamed protein product [Tuber aestivum]
MELTQEEWTTVLNSRKLRDIGKGRKGMDERERIREAMGDGLGRVRRPARTYRTPSRTIRRQEDVPAHDTGPGREGRMDVVLESPPSPKSLGGPQLQRNLSVSFGQDDVSMGGSLVEDLESDCGSELTPGAEGGVDTPTLSSLEKRGSGISWADQVEAEEAQGRGGSKRARSKEGALTGMNISRWAPAGVPRGPQSVVEQEVMDLIRELKERDRKREEELKGLRVQLQKLTTAVSELTAIVAGQALPAHNCGPADVGCGSKLPVLRQGDAVTLGNRGGQERASWAGIAAAAGGAYAPPGSRRLLEMKAENERLLREERRSKREVIIALAGSTRATDEEVQRVHEELDKETQSGGGSIIRSVRRGRNESGAQKLIVTALDASGAARLQQMGGTIDTALRGVGLEVEGVALVERWAGIVIYGVDRKWDGSMTELRKTLEVENGIKVMKEPRWLGVKANGDEPYDSLVVHISMESERAALISRGFVSIEGSRLGLRSVQDWGTTGTSVQGFQNATCVQVRMLDTITVVSAVTSDKDFVHTVK